MTTVIQPPALTQGETQGVLLHSVSWSTYESLLRDHPDAASPRFTYDRGDLLIMVTSPRHEKINRTLSLLVELLANEFNIESSAFGSTTYKRKDLQRGFEPDSCFYFKNEARIRGRETFDFSKDPPPDLVIEIDVSRPSLNRLPVFAAFGVPEVWCFDGEAVSILVLQKAQYLKSDASLALPLVNHQAITELLLEGLKIGRLEWTRKVRAWAQQVKLSNP